MALTAVAVMALGFGAEAAGAQPSPFAERAPSPRASLGMLDRLEGGRWELRTRDAPAVERVCMRDGRRLIQLRHPQQQCERVVVADEPNDVTVQYTCRGRGYGRTHIRRESEGSVRIEAQGIAEGLPFNFVAEGKRVGECAP
ncbi:MAG: hypothetical protein QM676_12500 [Novosphingobium sp.]